MSKVDKDQSGAAVRALPSDLTEREEIDLLCQVETYMNVTDKHSQTHPAAGAEEARIYSLVNGLIAKRFSDIGAAVRGEAVADSGSHHVWKRAILYTDTIGGKQTCRDDLWAITTTELKALQSARAADALDSQPTVSAVLTELRADLRELANNTETFGEYNQETARAALDGATDALDQVAAKYASSQPTDFEDRPLKARVLRNELAIIIGCQDGRTGAEKADAVLNWIEKQGQHVFVSASSQPTDGGVRNA